MTEGSRRVALLALAILGGWVAWSFDEPVGAAGGVVCLAACAAAAPRPNVWWGLVHSLGRSLMVLGACNALSLASAFVDGPTRRSQDPISFYAFAFPSIGLPAMAVGWGLMTHAGLRRLADFWTRERED